jgi:pimeloyl-ACP methyl ester carboxylesterase
MTRNQDHANIGTLTVPGARLHYEVRGSGPVLLLIPGGAADGAGFAPLAAALADRYTAVTYDPRGLGRSLLDGPPVDIPVETQADDAHRLLAAIGPEPAHVLASSGGGMTGLCLLTTHPEQVRTLIAHEPPITALLPERDELRAEGEALHEIWRTQGIDAALPRFLGGAQLDGGAEPDPEMMAMMMAMKPNFDFFIGYMLRELGAFRPDLSAVRTASSRVVIAGGVESKGQIAHRAATALAEALATPLVDFPGDHMGMAFDPGAFAERLHDVITGAH